MYKNHPPTNHNELSQEKGKKIMLIRNKSLETSMTMRTTIQMIEAEKIHSLCLPRFSPHCALILECSRKKYRKWKIFTTSQNEGTREGKPYQLCIYDILFICFPLLLLFRMVLKNLGLIKH